MHCKYIFFCLFLTSAPCLFASQPKPKINIAEGDFPRLKNKCAELNKSLPETLELQKANECAQRAYFSAKTRELYLALHKARPDSPEQHRALKEMRKSRHVDHTVDATSASAITAFALDLVDEALSYGSWPEYVNARLLRTLARHIARHHSY